MRLQRIVLLLLVLLLVIGLEVTLMSRCSSDETDGPGHAVTVTPSAPPATNEPNTTPTVPPIVVNTPQPGFTSPPLSTAIPTRPPTQPPAPTSPPTQRPTPTSAPTQPPPTQPPAPTVPPASVTASGSFSSDTGAGINMAISWQAVDQGNGTTRLRITGTVNSWSLQVMSQPISISFSGYSKSLMGSSVNYSGGSMASNSLFSTEMDVATGTSGTMTVTWSYNGTYGSGDNQVTLPTITASDYVYTN